MVDLFDSNYAWMLEQLLLHASQPVEYRRGASAIPLRAVLGRSRFEITDAAGMTRIEWSDRDFILAKQDLKINGTPIEPQRGDRIVYTAGDRTYTFEVASPGQEPVWRWYDRSGVAMRVHTKLVRQVGV